MFIYNINDGRVIRHKELLFTRMVHMFKEELSIIFTIDLDTKRRGMTDGRVHSHESETIFRVNGDTLLGEVT